MVGLQSCQPYHLVPVEGSESVARRRCTRVALLSGTGALLLLLLLPFRDDGQGVLYSADPAVRSVDGWLNYTLTVEAGVWHLPRRGISFRTRLYNGRAPSPVLYGRPGDRVRLLVRNRLGPDKPTPINDALRLGFREANTTNLHLHGIHDDAYHDDSFARIHPGEERLYEYTLAADSGTTLMYYHPHADGSTTLQSFGGMGGALVVEDDAQEAALGLPAYATRTLLLQALQLDSSKPDYISTQLSNGGTSGMSPSLVVDAACTGACLLLLVNGDEDGARQALPAGSWLRLKLVNAVTSAGGMLFLGFGGGGDGDRSGGSNGGGESHPGATACSLAVLAYDGVWLPAPRFQPGVLLPPGGRVELLMGCTQPGLYTFGTLDPGDFGGTVGAGHTAVRIEVSAGPALVARMQRLPGALPGPPPYYRDLRGSHERPTDLRVIEFSTPSGDNVVNGRPYNYSRSDFELELGTVAEWSLTSAEAPGTALKLHPYHQHMSHFQIVAITAPDRAAAGGDSFDVGGTPRLTPALFASVGDWRDSLPLYATVGYRIRFVAPFEGRMMVHCHVQKHSENGMLAIASIRGPRMPIG